MGTELLISLRTTLATFVITGLLYPALVTGLAQALFPDPANGSLQTDEHGQVVGSGLIGQAFANPAYFQPRPSAAGTGFDPLASSGSNLGPTSQKLRDRATADAERLRKENPDASPAFIAELITASGSGLDPHLSPQAVLWQAPRIARARGISADRVEKVIENQIEGRDLGLFGEPRVNVLRLNLALDRQFGKP